MTKMTGRFLRTILCAALLLSVSAVLAAENGEKAAYTPPALEQEGGWTMVVIPDPQQYTSTRNFPISEIMMNWIAEQRSSLNILHVLCVGDLVNANQKPEQWDFTSRAFALLDGKIPYAVCTGNHDYGETGPSANNRQSNLDKYFTPERNATWEGVLVEMGENAFGKKNMEVAAYERTAPNGQIVLVISLPFAPTDKNLDWARSVIEREKYADAFVILLTHQYMLPGARGNALDEGKGYQILKEDGNQGKEMWDKLVAPAKNIRMVVCGHHSAPDNFRDCVGFRTDLNAAGKKVHQMVFDTQALGGGWGGNGGDGWLRLLEFSADMKHVKARTFSPFFALSPTTQPLAWEKSNDNEFEFDID